MGCGASSAVPFTENIATGELENAQGQKTEAKTLLEGKIKLVLFSANLPPTNQFPVHRLVPLYNALKQKGEKFELVFVSDDQTEEAYTSYLAQFPWWSVPFADVQRRAGIRHVLNAPYQQCLIVLSESDEIITMDGEQAVMDDPQGNDFPWKPSKMAGIMDMAGGLAE